ncbi:MAG: cupin domain-containing protein [Candidatus Latescibacteria bacterium]|jgi:quercetin dioxygenase-like cupin family protein|nr:cupin domain-containing protein [Candidatus Latescibacterota bacterium]
MLVKHYTDEPAKTVEEGAKETTIRWLIAEPEGAPNFYMRLLEIGQDGCTPHHAHEWEHEVFILEGEGKLVGDGKSHSLTAGDAVFVPGNEVHHFESSGRQTMKMLCLIPAKK